VPSCFVIDAVQFLPAAGVRNVPAPAEDIHGPRSLAVLTEAQVLYDWGVYLALADQAAGPREDIRAPIVSE
jgi:hypothetical protein